jgi:hypothetical protein
MDTGFMHGPWLPIPTERRNGINAGMEAANQAYHLFGTALLDRVFAADVRSTMLAGVPVESMPMAVWTFDQHLMRLQVEPTHYTVELTGREASKLKGRR